MSNTQDHSNTGKDLNLCNTQPKGRQKNAKYQVSTNRGQAKHKVRYVESGGGEADPNCRLCTPVIKLKD